MVKFLHIHVRNKVVGNIIRNILIHVSRSQGQRSKVTILKIENFHVFHLFLSSIMLVVFICCIYVPKLIQTNSNSSLCQSEIQDGPKAAILKNLF